MRRICKAVASAVVLGTIGLAGLASPAGAELYWSQADVAPWSIGQVALDGSGADPSFAFSGLPADSLAADADYVYWSALGFAVIGRASRDGSSTEPRFMTIPGGAVAVAVDGDHIYWATGLGVIGRADLDGSNQSPAFIDTGVGPIAGLTVADGDIYWSKPYAGLIGRARADGTSIELELIEDLATPRGIAIVGDQLFWASEYGHAIGRATTDGGSVDPDFVSVNQPRALVHHAGYLYWTGSPGTIGRVAVDGTGASSGLVSGIFHSPGLAVAADPVRELAASTGAIELGSVAVGSLGAPASFAIANGGNATIAIDRVRVAGADPSDFVVARDDCSRNTLRPDTSCTVAVRFGPTSVGARGASLEVASNVPGAPLTVAASGEGIAPALAPSGGGGPGAGAGGPSTTVVVSPPAATPAVAAPRVVRTRCTTKTRRIKVPLRGKRRAGGGRRASTRYRWVDKRVTRCVRRVVR